jgi:D-aminopeptidase
VTRVRARDLGLAPGTLPPGPFNAITDVPGIRVGHATVIEPAGAGHGELRTGVTAVVHDVLIGRGTGSRRTLPAGLAVFNGFGKMTGSTQIAELGTIETPVLLTSTLSVFRVADALLTYLHELPAYAQTVTLNPVVAETNDSYLSDIWARAVTAEPVRAALDGASSALGFKAGIGTSSRRVALVAGPPVTVGAIVQANFGGMLTVGGVPVPSPETRPGQPGSCVIVLATDASLSPRGLERLAARAFAAMARTGSDFSGTSGDYALAIGTGAADAATGGEQAAPADVLFTAAIEATEEAILNSLFMAETTMGYRGHVARAVPLELVTGRPGSLSES